MKAIGTAEGAALETAILDAMLDTCTIDTYTETAGELNEPLVEYVPSAPSPCRFRGKLSRWMPNADYDISAVDALLQLPKDTVITSLDRVTITARFGRVLDVPLTYDVKGEPTPAIMSLHVSLMERHL